MKILLRLLAVLAFLIITSGCAVTNSYGPYMGKVVDKETEEPIEGAVVFLRFFNDCFGPTTSFADAIETLTDANGEFHIPSHRIFTFRPLCGWDPDCEPIVFKPGYGAFPGHIETSIVESQGAYLPEKKPVTIKLPKLTTREERIDNQSKASFTSKVPYEKWRNLFRLRNEERKNIELKPFSEPM
ncbi:MAG: carboxypeptidase-like regulatory domain-containing protein [Proteobacteria bacterium]|nr:carboxypeptidase-like regulatory domain-containing protein [Pseudomonadota bacterium]MBU1708677.1 carboxypeptidase-like regulatory domain-containing protein [Pseudomonadota bacterium]